ncbi:CBS domain-containing protein [Pelomicrobium methylotrophicum]|uniref:CBS domain-containing protein n=1 Tax=Pelomicrobium methylotrophicum TaxID=2602750 RepID=A0A5C7ET32_9PROT|nr:CBS domain-containing protein [Pelomicrobium methylotrophicum]TXF10045.1 CBS domain-containing protein [Pelomicrobium methylotrophicum]
MKLNGSERRDDPELITVMLGTSVREIAKLLLENRISIVPMVDAADCSVGIVSEGDLMRRNESATLPYASLWLSFPLFLTMASARTSKRTAAMPGT